MLHPRALRYRRPFHANNSAWSCLAIGRIHWRSMCKDLKNGLDTKRAYAVLGLAVLTGLLVLYLSDSVVSQPSWQYGGVLFGALPGISSIFRRALPSSLIQDQIKQAFLELWHQYEQHAWGKDVYSPIALTGKNMGPKPLGWMVVDSIDTLMLMGADKEVERARDWILNDLDYNFDYNVNLFETTIRMLGGLLSAHHLSGDSAYLNKAVDLADRLLGAFDSPSGVPYSSVNLLSGKALENHDMGGLSSTAEVATLQLEFKYLSKLTGNFSYWEKVDNVMRVLHQNTPSDGLAPIYVLPATGQYASNLIRLGSRGDSYYEYLLKQYWQTNASEPVYWEMYRDSVRGVKKHLRRYSRPNNLTFIGELESGLDGPFLTKMDHLVCFYGGLLALGATNGLSYNDAVASSFWSHERQLDYEFAEELTYTCYHMYKDMPLGLAPEIAVFNTDPASTADFFVKPADAHNLQRPETVESLFYMYRFSGDQRWRDYGYDIFASFMNHTRFMAADGLIGFSSVNGVTTPVPSFRDNTELFWWAETLKYLYLLFDDSNKIPLDRYVFNTEAHAFPRFSPNESFIQDWTSGL